MAFKELLKRYIYPAVVFCGGTIGVGFLSLPYIAMVSGIWVLLCYFLVLVALIIGINLIFAEISLKTPDFKRFPGFVGHYLGKWTKAFAMLSIILGSYGVLLVYLVVAREFLGNNLTYLFIYFLLASVIVYFGIKVITKVELFVLFALIVSLFLIFIDGFSQIKLVNIFNNNFSIFNFQNFFLPYGPILFAFWGIGIIPEVEEMLVGKKKLLKSTITISTLAIAVFYILFVFIILGITGGKTTTVALTGLKDFLSPAIIFISLLVGVLATFTAFITQGIVLKKMFEYDLGIKHWQAFIMTCFIPLILFLLGLRSFIPMLSFTGGVLLGINGILILLMYKKVGGKNIIIYPMAIIFVLGIIYQVYYLWH